MMHSRPLLLVHQKSIHLGSFQLGYKSYYQIKRNGTFMLKLYHYDGHCTKGAFRMEEKELKWKVIVDTAMGDASQRPDNTMVNPKG